MTTFVYAGLAALGGAAIYANLPTRLTIGAIAPTYTHLSKALLVPVKDENNMKMEDGIEEIFLFVYKRSSIFRPRRFFPRVRLS